MAESGYFFAAVPSEPNLAMEHATSTRTQPRRITYVSALAIGAVALMLVAGWRELWFMTDDSYITFRYIDHFRRGWGYTWNPPPFAPVEGYSNFLWMVLLHLVWVTTGLEPPKTANVVSLLLAAGSLALAFATTYQLAWSPGLRKYRFWLALAVTAFAATNRTFLTWTSSGLETSLFGFCTMLWTFGMLAGARTRETRALAVATTGGALAALTRPDGLLLAAAAFALLAVVAVSTRDVLRAARAGLPLLLVPLHVLWRRAYYGEWVPNTYFAKQVRPWPEAGLRYLGSFILEHALVLWVPLLLYVAVRALAHRTWHPRDLLRGAPLGAVLVALTLLAHAAYFVLLAGGDHFEYRVFAHTVLPLGMLLLVLLDRARLPPPWLFASFAIIAAAGEVIPWIHYERSRAFDTRPASFKLFVPVADAFPAGPLRAYAQTFDDLQRWMMPRHVGTRHQEHKIFLHEDAKKQWPKRRWGTTVGWDQRGVLALNTVGYAGWVLPEVAIIDIHGLNDSVVAHTPVQPNAGATRLMAHERTPPPGYVECFRPNVAHVPGRAWVDPARPRLSDEAIRDCERHFRSQQQVLASGK